MILSARELDPLIRQTIFYGKVFCFQRVDSTNDLAMEAASQGASEGTVFIANEQTHGRGRGGSFWHSDPDAGIYLSVILRPRLSPADALVLSLMAGIAVHNAVQSLIGISPDLRWPNDLLFGAKKFAGILTELNADADQIHYAVVGIGINVNQQLFSPEISEIATSIHLITGKSWPRTGLLAALLESLDGEYRKLSMHNEFSRQRPEILRKFESLSSYARRKRVRVHEGEGYEGTTAGLDDRGFLRVQTQNGMRTVFSGGVRELKPQA